MILEHEQTVIFFYKWKYPCENIKYKNVSTFDVAELFSNSKNHTYKPRTEIGLKTDLSWKILPSDYKRGKRHRGKKEKEKNCLGLYLFLFTLHAISSSSSLGKKFFVFFTFSDAEGMLKERRTYHEYQVSFYFL